MLKCGTPIACAESRASRTAAGEQQLRSSSPGHRLHRHAPHHEPALGQGKRGDGAVDAAAQTDDDTFFPSTFATSPVRPALVR